MYVDGASHRPKVEEVQALHRNPVAHTAPASRQFPSTEPLYLPGSSHPAHILRDRFEHLQEAASEKGGYPPIASIIQELRASLGEDYHEEIASLESAIESRGLPLIAEPYTDGVVYHSFLDAYERVSLNHGDGGKSEQHDLLDTSG